MTAEEIKAVIGEYTLTGSVLLWHGPKGSGKVTWTWFDPLVDGDITLHVSPGKTIRLIDEERSYAEAWEYSEENQVTAAHSFCKYCSAMDARYCEKLSRQPSFV